MPRPTRAAGLAAVALASALSLTACGDDSEPTSASSSASPEQEQAHNAADVAFLTEMIPHHGQALEMAELALEKAQNAEVKELATAIRDAQDPEIQAMSERLEAWEEPVPEATGSAAHSGHDMSSGGMMTPEEMAELEAAEGAAFDRMWTEMMIRHHEGAVEMSESVLSEGEADEVATLAEQIRDAQTEEIATMQSLLEALPA